LVTWQTAVDEKSFFNALIGCGLLSAAGGFLLLFFVPAPYGRHVRKGWGPTINNTAGWILMELPAALTLPLLVAWGTRPVNRISLVFVLLWELHYLHRTFVYPFRIRGRAKRMPVLILISAVLFNVFNGYLNGRYLGHFAQEYPNAWLMDPRFLAGAFLFLSGFTINIRADRTLFRLRAPGETGYKIPHGGLYRWVSCPNYLGELLEWIGWAIATWSLPGVVFAIWTAANLVPRAWAHHRWYRTTFEDYPPERKAVIPFVF
jgi:3-oxo-5-alpha-steroid 4-dehydrogenase 1